METVTVRINTNTNNTAFYKNGDYAPNKEVARILRLAAQYVADGDFTRSLHIDGNTVGVLQLSDARGNTAAVIQWSGSEPNK
jgi:hypothetical protein